MTNTYGLRMLLIGLGWLLMGHLPASAQAKAELNASSAPAAPRQVAQPLAVPMPADTGAFPLSYCTSLPRLSVDDWEQDYAKYERLLTPEIRRTQLGLSYLQGNVQVWWCQPSASPHAQLDTLTRVANAAQLEGKWKSVLARTIVHRDSAVIREKKFYRSARLKASDEQVDVTLADGRITLLARHGATAPLEKLGRKKYALVNGRYLLVYGLAKGAGAVSQVGLDPAGRLVLHSCAVTERKVRGQYLTYETVLNQTVFERQP
ncbi:hypothetical protein [Hymenobacter ruricola]|uniref:Uncharacterized protein n=1 Tax=Hymenobacter ruricola TaxID=2791023 RepID=A0ABS0I9J9_9BACT|nr:hypothetical protein [Hymenobacter ruricola]MBF9223594.1 hypothetical protein [Hymenobacter ruricola]